MKKLLLFIFSLISLFIVFQASKVIKSANAAIECSLAVHKQGGGSTPADNTDKWAVVNIDTRNEIQEATDYKILIEKTDGQHAYFNSATKAVDEHADNGFTDGFTFKPGVTNPVDGSVIWNPNGVIIFSVSDLNSLRNEGDTFDPGNYSVRLVQGNQNGRDMCNPMRFEIKENKTPTSDYCSVILDEDQSFKNSDGIRFRVNFAEGGNKTGAQDKHRVRLRNSTGNFSTYEDFTTSELESQEFTRIPRNGGLNTEGYQIEVFEHALEHNFLWENEGKSCVSDFVELGVDGGKICKASDSEAREKCGVNSKKALSQPCRDEDMNVLNKNADDEINKGCTKIKTALGYVGTSASGFIRWVLGFVLGIGGGIVILIIIIGGYRIMTSQGDPEKVKNAREQITAAILGLLFIIFSLVILQLITDDILQLPGFGR